MYWILYQYIRYWRQSLKQNIIKQIQNLTEVYSMEKAEINVFKLCNWFAPLHPCSASLFTQRWYPFNLFTGDPHFSWSLDIHPAWLYLKPYFLPYWRIYMPILFSLGLGRTKLLVLSFGPKMNNKVPPTTVNLLTSSRHSRKLLLFLD